jgi:hypothetical protein
MKLLKIISGLAIGLGMLQVATAAPMPPVGKWQCFASNNRGVRWYQNANDRQRAMKKVRQRCYAAGSRRCYVDRDDCRFNQGKFWTCHVQGRRGRSWKATDTTSKAACHQAKRKCRHWHDKRDIDNYRCNVVSERRT